MTNTADDDEWEYEYDENETEDFYVPVDLSNVPEAQGPVTATARPGHPTLLKSRLRALQAVRTQAEIATDTSDTQDPTASMGELQIIGLHTSNPLITYNGQLLSCHWASTIGTDMFFVKPNPDDDTLGQPLRSLPAVDLLAIGSAKLIARVGGLRPRDDLFDTTDGGDQMVAETGAQPASTEASQPSANDEEAATSASQPAPQSFLARLNEIKAKRGETSRLAVSQTTNGARLISKEADMPSSAQPEEDVQMGGI